MSSQITTAFVQQYSANVQMLSQQMGSLLRDKVRVESVVGKNAFLDQVGSVTAVEKMIGQITKSGNKVIFPTELIDFTNIFCLISKIPIIR